MIRETRPPGGHRMPLIIEAAGGRQDLADTVRNCSAPLHERLLEHGALLFRGFRMAHLEDFARFAREVSPERSDYLYRSTPRTLLADRIFTASEYPPAQEIALHNENAYQRIWPLKIAFCCLQPAPSGGETPIADMRKVSAALGQGLLDELESRRIRYLRHYRPRVDLPWQSVFQTEDRTALARFCNEHDISHEWLDADTLRTAQVCQGTARHPVLAERVFFNQAHLFHVSHMGEAAARSAIELFGRERLPRQAAFGDGKDIPLEYLERIRASFREHMITFAWRAGDVLLLDNMQAAHGRRPFRGTRQVLATLLEPSSTRPLAGETSSRGEEFHAF